MNGNSEASVEVTVGVDFGSANVRAAAAGTGLCFVAPLGDTSGPCAPCAVGVANGRPVLGQRARTRAATDPAHILLDPLSRLQKGPWEVDGKTWAAADLLGWWLVWIRDRVQQDAKGRMVALSVCAPMASTEFMAASFGAAGDRLRIRDIDVVAGTTAVAAGVVATTRLSGGVLAVVDAGARHVEAAIVRLGSRGFDVLSRASKRGVGGRSLDKLVAEAFVCDVASREAFEGLDPAVRELVLQHCGPLRRDLSSASEATLSMPFLAHMLGRANIPDWRLGRDRLDELAQELVRAVASVCSAALDAAGLEKTDVNHVAAVGGLARMPIVKGEIERAMGGSPLGSVDVDGSAAMGAALIGASRRGAFSFRGRDADAVEIDLSEPGEEDRVAVLPEAPPPSSRTSAISHRHESIGAMMAIRPPMVSGPPEEPPAAEAQDAGAADSSAPSPESSTFRVVIADGRTSQPDDEVPSEGRPSIGTMLRPSAQDAVAQEEPPRPSRAPSVDVPREGSFRNARTPVEMLALPFARRLTAEDVSEPALPVLLMHYGRCQGLTGTLTLEAQSGRVVVPIVESRVVLPSYRERDALMRAFTWGGGTYRFEAGAVEQASASGDDDSIAKVAIEGLRFVLREVEEAEIESSLGERMMLVPKVTRRGMAMADALGFWVGEKRFLRYRCDGSLVAGEALKAGGVSRGTALQTLFVLHMLGEIKWSELDRSKEPSLAELTERLALRLARANAFEILEVHWSAPVEEAQAAYTRIVEQYGTGSEAGRVAPAAAAQIERYLKEGLAVMLDESKRLALLKQIRPDLDFGSLADLMQKRAQALALKGDERNAKDADRVRKSVQPLVRKGLSRWERELAAVGAPPKKTEGS